MNKSEMKKKPKSRIRILQKIQYSAFLLMLIEVVIWAVTKMSLKLLVVILLTCAVEVVVGLMMLTELAVHKKDRRRRDNGKRRAEDNRRMAQERMQ